MGKYGAEAAQVAVASADRVAALNGAGSPLVNQMIEELKVTAPVGSAPQSPATAEQAAAMDADEAILYEAVNREGIDPAELEAIMKDFLEKYGLAAARDVIGRGAV